MMRINTGIVCVLAALTAGACSSGNGSGPTPDAAPVVCGDNVCAASEVHSCPQDCGNGGSNHGAVCGNGQCETSMGESQTTCPTDCGGGSNAAVCGNGTCEAGEDATSCPTDCGGGGSGSGALNCSDPNTAFGCAFCSAAMVCTPPYDMASCAACGF